MNSKDRGFWSILARLHAGEILKLSPSNASRELLAACRVVIEDTLPEISNWSALRSAEFFSGDNDRPARKLVATLKKSVYQDIHVRSACQSMLISLIQATSGSEFDASETISSIDISCSNSEAMPGLIETGMGIEYMDIRYDPPRLRINTVVSAMELQEITNSEHRYSIHRDTWYANPQNQINLWIPLHDSSSGDSFVFYPQFYHVAVSNDSCDFDYDIWKDEVGFGRSDLSAIGFYPRTEMFSLERCRPLQIECREGEIILFSSHHLHSTSKNTTNQNRISIDFRLSFGDLPGVANIDNKSRGDASCDYLPLFAGFSRK